MAHHVLDVTLEPRNYTTPGDVTIVELLIVIVVIGILAAIVIVAYNGIQQRANASAAQSAASQAGKKLLAYAVDNSDSYPATLATAGISNSGSTSYQYSVNNSVSPKTYCITATTSSSSYWVSNASTSPTSGGCPGHGLGGVAPITNLTTNPSVENDITTWQAPFGAGNTATRVTSMSYSGSASLLLQRTAVISDSRMGRQLLGSLAVGSYTYSSWVYVADGAIGNVSLGVEIPGGAGTTGTVTSSGGVIAQWKRVSVPFNVTTVGTNVYINFIAGQGQLGSLYVDAALLEAGTTLNNYADGSSPNWVWNGTPNNSTSTGPPL